MCFKSFRSILIIGVLQSFPLFAETQQDSSPPETGEQTQPKELSGHLAPFYPVMPPVPHGPLPPGHAGFRLEQTLIPPAFDTLPQVDRVPTVSEKALQKNCQCVEAIEGGMQIVFNDPAQFPLAKFGRMGERWQETGAILYEGMTLQVSENGYYQIQFVVEAPRSPMTLRLQFVLFEHIPFQPPIPRGTVTLPPITICPEPTHCGHPSLAWTVKHRGWSPVLQAVDCVNSGRYIVRRTGTARFGSEPDFDFFKNEVQ